MIAILLLGIFALFAVLLFIVFLSGLIASLISRVPYVPTRQVDVEDMVNRLGITPADTFIDLGSGNGRVVFTVERLSGAKSRGYELPSWMMWYAQLKKIFTGSRAEFVSGNFFKHPWSDATVVYCYLFPSLMSKLSEKAQEELRPGTRVVARDFPIPGLNLTEQWRTPSNHTIFLYHI